MCFRVKSKRDKIAKQNIPCWKELESDNRPFYQMDFPPYKRRVINPIVKIKMRGSAIDEGYHSWRALWIAKEDTWRGIMSPNIKKFIIPAGTRYYENDTEYVSETIIMQ